jgi:hypothetical protein
MKTRTHSILVDMCESGNRLKSACGNESLFRSLLSLDMLQLDFIWFVPSTDRVPSNDPRAPDLSFEYAVYGQFPCDHWRKTTHSQHCSRYFAVPSSVGIASRKSLGCFAIAYPLLFKDSSIVSVGSSNTGLRSVIGTLIFSLGR